MKRYLLLLPCLAFLIAFFMVPLFVTFFESVYQTGKGWVVYRYLDFFRQKLSRTVYVRSVLMSLSVTIVALLIGYPAAMAVISVRSDSLKSLSNSLTIRFQTRSKLAGAGRVSGQTCLQGWRQPAEKSLSDAGCAVALQIRHARSALSG